MDTRAKDQTEVRLCIIGGAPRELGGVEIFCARAFEAAKAHWHDSKPIWIPANTTFMKPSRVPSLISGLMTLYRSRKLGINVVWLNASNVPDILYLLLSRLLNIPVLVTLHMGKNSRIQRNAILRHIYAILLMPAARIGLLFEQQANEIRLPRRVPRSVIRTFLPQACLDEHLRFSVKSDVLQIVHAGRLSYEKGSLLFVDLCAALKRNRISFEAKIIGRGNDALIRTLQDRIEVFDLGDVVKLEGWLDGPDLMSAFRQADVLVHLSSSDSFPLTVLEAMSSNAFPLVVDLPGVVSMTNKYGGKVVGHADTLRDAIIWAESLDLEYLRRQNKVMGEMVREDYKWISCIGELKSAINKVLSASFGPTS